MKQKRHFEFVDVYMIDPVRINPKMVSQLPVDILQGLVWWYVTVKNTIMMVQNHQGGNENDFSR